MLPVFVYVPVTGPETVPREKFTSTETSLLSKGHPTERFEGQHRGRQAHERWFITDGKWYEAVPVVARHRTPPLPQRAVDPRPGDCVKERIFQEPRNLTPARASPLGHPLQ